ncbi:hypothetical protein BJV77DRAFT_681682 [Russula vinacea]|nr:hypothetical protein BJV77DRAFT_681682 [Russula vinacea]
MGRIRLCRRPTLGAERRLGHQRTDIPMLRRTQDEYIIHLLSVQLSHGHFAYRWIDDGTLAGEAATDEGSNPLDDIVMPGKVRGLFSFFTRIYSKRLKKTLCDTSFIFPWLYPLFVGFDDRLYDSDTGRATTTANSSLRTRSSLLLAGARSHFTINLTSRAFPERTRVGGGPNSRSTSNLSDIIAMRRDNCLHKRFEYIIRGAGANSEASIVKVLQPVRLSDPYHSVANRSHIRTHMSFGRRLHLENTRTALDGAWGVERFIRATKVSAAWNSRKHRLGLSLRPLRVPLPCFHPNYARIHRYQISRHVLRRDHGFKLTRRLGEA